jgi:hypothetical protein
MIVQTHQDWAVACGGTSQQPVQRVTLRPVTPHVETSEISGPVERMDRVAVGVTPDKEQVVAVVSSLRGVGHCGRGRAGSYISEGGTVACVGPLDLRAQAQVGSALQADTAPPVDA